MKRLFSVILAAVLLICSLPVTASAEPVTINVYNWGQYISDGSDGYIDVNKAFTEATGIGVNYMTFDSNETMYTKLKTGGSSNWPYSDLEMMEATVDEYLGDWQTNGTPFHAYYMTVSGHANWGWGNAMSAKNRDAAVAAYPNASQPVQGYIAANLELEAAMTYLLERLEQAGALDDTVICLSADHYPYALVEESTDYYQELSGRNDTEKDTSRYRNTLILWCGSMEDPVKVSTPCSAVDIVPTLSNLFGLPYDSRLLSGRDIFAYYTPTAISTSMPLVILPTPVGNSWATAAGIYESRTGTFTPYSGITVPDSYADIVNSIVDAKYNYARAVIQYDYYRVLFGE